MRRLLAAAAAATLPFALAGVAYAAPDQFVLSPTSGPAGSSFSASDDEGECAPPETAEDPYVIVVLFDADDEPVAGNEADLADAGNFNVSVTVPGDTAAGEYGVAVACFEGNDEDEEPYFAFDDQTFTVTASGQQTPGPTQTTSPPQGQTPTPRAPAATAVQGQPRFTG